MSEKLIDTIYYVIVTVIFLVSTVIAAAQMNVTKLLFCMLAGVLIGWFMLAFGVGDEELR